MEGLEGDRGSRPEGRPHPSTRQPARNPAPPDADGPSLHTRAKEVDNASIPRLVSLVCLRDSMSFFCLFGKRTRPNSSPPPRTPSHPPFHRRFSEDRLRSFVQTRRDGGQGSSLVKRGLGGHVRRHVFGESLGKGLEGRFSDFFFFIFDLTPFLYLPLLTRVRLNAGFMAVMFFLTARAAVRLTGLGCYEKVGWGEFVFFFYRKAGPSLFSPPYLQVRQVLGRKQRSQVLRRQENRQVLFRDRKVELRRR